MPRVVLRAAVVALGGLLLPACGGGSDDAADTPLVEVPSDDADDGADDTTTTTEAEAGGTEAALQACLSDSGVEVTDPADPNLPITAGEGSGPAIVNGVAGTGVRVGDGAAVFFVYDSDAEAEAAASALGEAAAGNVVVVAGVGFPVSAANAILLCVRGDGGEPAAPTEPGDAAGDVDACVTAGGVEITHANDPDLVVNGRGATLPVVDGVEGTGARFAGITAVFFVYASDAAASQAAQSFLDAPDVEQNAPRITVVAFQTVLFAMHPDFPQDAQVVILDCAAPL